MKAYSDQGCQAPKKYHNVSPYNLCIILQVSQTRTIDLSEKLGPLHSKSEISFVLPHIQTWPASLIMTVFALKKKNISFGLF